MFNDAIVGQEWMKQALSGYISAMSVVNTSTTTHIPQLTAESYIKCRLNAIVLSNDTILLMTSCHNCGMKPTQITSRIVDDQDGYYTIVRECHRCGATKVAPVDIDQSAGQFFRELLRSAFGHIRR